MTGSLPITEADKGQGNKSAVMNLSQLRFTLDPWTLGRGEIEFNLYFKNITFLENRLEGHECSGRR